MRHLSGLLVLSILCLATAALLPGHRAEAEDTPRTERAPAKTGTSLYVFDVRIVRVETPEPEGIEQPCPFLSGSGSTTRATWPEILTALKKRGRTTVLMDGRTTALHGTKTRISEERSIPGMAVQSRVLKGSGETSENLHAVNTRIGCTVELLVSDVRTAYKQLHYNLQTRATLATTHPGATRFNEARHSWEGSHPALDNETLVLTHRQQVLTPGEAAATGIEIYCFISMGR